MTRLLTIAVLCTAIALAAPALAGAAPDAAKAAKPSCAESVSAMPWTLNMCLAERPLPRVGGVVTVDLGWLEKADCCDNAETACDSRCPCGWATLTCTPTSFGCRIRCFCLRCPV